MKSTRPEVVVVTGASAGIGRATAREFAAQGARVALLARDHERLEAARQEVEQLGGKAIAITVDMSDAKQVEEAAQQVERELGPIDIWVNNAMVTILAPVSEISAEEFKRVTDVTYHGYVWGTMAALKHMRKRNRGTIVQIGSAMAYRSIPLQAPYCGAKHAIKGFTESVRTELLHEKSEIHITIVEMPGVNTPQFEWCKTTLTEHPKPMGKVFQPEVAARAVVWAAHARRREIMVGMPSRMAVWGEKLIPGLLDHLLAKKGISGQKAGTPIAADRPANLWQPVPGDFAARGRFDQKARNSSAWLWITMNRKWLLLGAAAIVTVAGERARAKRHGS
jgi:NADP-dependent 3-hydroxy acid dehydrogenase YdfG